MYAYAKHCTAVRPGMAALRKMNLVVLLDMLTKLKLNKRQNKQTIMSFTSFNEAPKPLLFHSR